MRMDRLQFLLHWFPICRIYVCFVDLLQFYLPCIRCNVFLLLFQQFSPEFLESIFTLGNQGQHRHQLFFLPKSRVRGGILDQSRANDQANSTIFCKRLGSNRIENWVGSGQNLRHFHNCNPLKKTFLALIPSINCLSILPYLKTMSSKNTLEWDETDKVGPPTPYRMINFNYFNYHTDYSYSNDPADTS